jgi:hypothetical protein
MMTTADLISFTTVFVMGWMGLQCRWNKCLRLFVLLGRLWRRCGLIFYRILDVIHPLYNIITDTTATYMTYE